MRKEPILEQFRILRDIPVLDAYCGLYKVRVKNGRNPEDCINVRNAKDMIFSPDVLGRIKKAINKLSELLNE